MKLVSFLRNHIILIESEKSHVHRHNAFLCKELLIVIKNDLYFLRKFLISGKIFKILDILIVYVRDNMSLTLLRRNWSIAPFLLMSLIMIAVASFLLRIKVVVLGIILEVVIKFVI